MSAPEVADLAFARARAEARELLAARPRLRSERTAAFLAGDLEPSMPKNLRDPMISVTLRLPSAMVGRAERLAGYIADLPELATLPNVTRSDAYRVALLRGLAVLEAECLPAAEQAELPGVGG